MPRMDRIGTGHTTVSTENGKTTVRLHSTDVVVFSAKEIVLNSGTWRTATTKNRMNQTSNQFDLGFDVTHKDFGWFVSFNGKVLPFVDGMKLKR